MARRRSQRRAAAPRRHPSPPTAWRILAGGAIVAAATTTAAAAASWPRLTLPARANGIAGDRSGGDSGAPVLHVERAVWDEAAAVDVDGAVEPDLAAYRDAYRAATAATAAARAAEAAAASTHPARVALARLAVAAGVAWRRQLPAGPSFAADEAAAAAGQLTPLAVRQVGGAQLQRVTGTASTFDLYLDPAIPPAETNAIAAAARLWADVWPSSVPVRTTVKWASDLSAQSLGATFAPRFVSGGPGPTRDDTQYGAPLYMSLTGTDPTPEREHVAMSLNRGVAWHSGTDSAPRNRFDLTTVAAHELGHGLFFTGRIGFDRTNSRVGVGGGDPARFDSFIADMDDNGVVASCGAGRSVDSQGLLNAVTAQGLSFVVNGSGEPGRGPRVDFPLYAPASYRPGSSVYHFDGGGDQLSRGCTISGISQSQCSSLMVAELPAGKTARSLGGNTLAVMRAMLDQTAQGLPGGTCSVPSNAPGSVDEGGLDGFPGENGGGLRFSIPTWAVITLGVAAAVSVVLFVSALITNVVFPAIRRGGAAAARHPAPRRGGGGQPPPPPPPMPGAAPAMGPPAAPPCLPSRMIPLPRRTSRWSHRRPGEVALSPLPRYDRRPRSTNGMK